MKICHISTFYPPLVYGGAEIYVRKIAEKMAKHNEVVIITTSSKICRKPIVEIKNNIKIYRIHPINIYALYNTRNKPIFAKVIWNIIDIINVHSYKVIKDILKKEKPDIVHIHHFKGYSYSFDAVKSLNIPLVYTAHNYFMGCPKEHLFRESSCRICNNPTIFCKIYRIFQKFTKDNKPDIVTAPTQFVLNQLRSIGFFSDVKMIKLPLGIELNNEKFINKNYNYINILFVGRITKYKGLDVLLKSFEMLNNFKNIKLHIVGSNLLGEYTWKNIPNVIFHGYLPDNKLAELYRKSSILVVPSIWYEVFGLVIIEGFKHGLPVLGSNIGGIPELIEDGYNGFLFEPGNIFDLKNKIENLIENKNLLKKLSRNALKSAKKYDINDHVRALYKLYENLI